ncbi:hypothetical protein FIU87_04400 [Bacillus sp. THAF10]|uniref:hypothetical protein n=1 Tax=Bacillus sp. THAF10 TaxID=2587848 RepID=UPI0012693356|nr:hypothetical protein [Bacillus sp. THAF10]QFT87888.1 hypothetical protein FIU87_04400 [Bacillus sp. THAF10]
MKNNSKLALYVSLTVLIGIPIGFLIATLATGDWRFFMYGAWGGFMGGFPGLVFSMVAMRREKAGV